MDDLADLIDFLKDDRAHVRKEAVGVVLGLTASDDGRRLLRTTRVAQQLRRLIGDSPAIAELAVKALVNLSADAELMEQILRQGMVTALMESLRDEDCAHKRVIVLLLSNLSQTAEGCDQLLQKVETGGALMGLHFRRLIQWFVAPVKVPAGAAAGKRAAPSTGAEGDERDTFEHVASILQNMTQMPEARRIILEPERGILPALLPQLASTSAVRRRGVAGAVRNCLFEQDDKYTRFLLSPGVDVVTNLLLPLAGPDRYRAEEKVGMNAALYKHGSRKQRESDPSTRRLLVESIQLIATLRMGRDHLRRVKAYPVLRTFHEWLEGHEKPAVDPLADAAAAGGSAAASAAAIAAELGLDTKKADPLGHLVSTDDRKPGAGGSGDDDDEELPLSPDDEATVNAINRIVQQVFRDDEVKHTGEVTGIGLPSAGDASSTAIVPAAPVFDAKRAAAAAALMEKELARRTETATTTSALAGGAAAAGAAAPVAAGGAGTAAPAAGAASAAGGAAAAPTAATTSTGEPVVPLNPHQTVVPMEEARAAAVKVSRGADLDASAVSDIRMVVPDWEDDDFELPEEYKPAGWVDPKVRRAMEAAAAAAGGGATAAAVAPVPAAAVAAPAAAAAVAPPPAAADAAAPAPASATFKAVESAGMGGID